MTTTWMLFMLFGLCIFAPASVNSYNYKIIPTGRSFILKNILHHIHDVSNSNESRHHTTKQNELDHSKHEQINEVHTKQIENDLNIDNKIEDDETKQKDQKAILSAVTDAIEINSIYNVSEVKDTVEMDSIHNVSAVKDTVEMDSIHSVSAVRDAIEMDSIHKVSAVTDAIEMDSIYIVSPATDAVEINSIHNVSAVTDAIEMDSIYFVSPATDAVEINSIHNVSAVPEAIEMDSIHSARLLSDPFQVTDTDSLAIGLQRNDDIFSEIDSLYTSRNGQGGTCMASRPGERIDMSSGDVQVLLLAPLLVGEHCDIISWSGLRMTWAAQWALSTLLPGRDLGGLSVGLMVANTCNRAQLANKALLEEAMTRLECAGDSSCTQHYRLLGVMAPSQSHHEVQLKASDMANALDTPILPMKIDIVATKPNNNNIIRALVQVLSELEIQHITVAYSADEQGEEELNQFTDVAEKALQCIYKLVEIKQEQTIEEVWEELQPEHTQVLVTLGSKKLVSDYLKKVYFGEKDFSHKLEDLLIYDENEAIYALVFNKFESSNYFYIETIILKKHFEIIEQFEKFLDQCSSKYVGITLKTNGMHKIYKNVLHERTPEVLATYNYVNRYLMAFEKVLKHVPLCETCYNKKKHIIDSLERLTDPRNFNFELERAAKSIDFNDIHPKEHDGYYAIYLHRNNVTTKIGVANENKASVEKIGIQQVTCPFLCGCISAEVTESSQDITSKPSTSIVIIPNESTITSDAVVTSDATDSAIISKDEIIRTKISSKISTQGTTPLPTTMKVPSTTIKLTTPIPTIRTTERLTTKTVPLTTKAPATTEEKSTPTLHVTTEHSTAADIISNIPTTMLPPTKWKYKPLSIVDFMHNMVYGKAKVTPIPRDMVTESNKIADTANQMQTVTITPDVNDFVIIEAVVTPSYDVPILELPKVYNRQRPEDPITTTTTPITTTPTTTTPTTTTTTTTTPLPTTTKLPSTTTILTTPILTTKTNKRLTSKTVPLTTSMPVITQEKSTPTLHVTTAANTIINTTETKWKHKPLSIVDFMYNMVYGGNSKSTTVPEPMVTESYNLAVTANQMQTEAINELSISEDIIVKPSITVAPTINKLSTSSSISAQPSIEVVEASKISTIPNVTTQPSIELTIAETTVVVTEPSIIIPTTTERKDPVKTSVATSDEKIASDFVTNIITDTITSNVITTTQVPKLIEVAFVAPTSNQASNVPHEHGNNTSKFLRKILVNHTPSLKKGEFSYCILY